MLYAGVMKTSAFTMRITASILTLIPMGSLLVEGGRLQAIHMNHFVQKLDNQVSLAVLSGNISNPSMQECTGPDFSSCCLGNHVAVDGKCAELVGCANAGLECGMNAQCAKLPEGTVQCVCAPFFEGDGYECLPVDTCASDKSPCHPDATCSDGLGGAPTCTCNEGSFGFGYDCKSAANDLNPNADMYTFGPDTTVKLVVKRDSKGTLEFQLGSCYSLHLSFDGQNDSHAVHNGNKVTLDSQLIGQSSCVVLVHRELDELTTLVYTSDPNGHEWRTSTATHKYDANCTFPGLHVVAPDIDASAISVAVTQDLERVA